MLHYNVPVVSRCLLFLAVSFSATAPAASLDDLRQSIFKITVTSAEPTFSDPWKRNPGGTSTGTGFFIGNHRILTNAHVVANATFITVQRDGDSRPVHANVEFIAHDADLAILRTSDPDLLKSLRPLRFGSLPKLRTPVATIGFPTGGEQLSITEGIVSRVSYRRYVHHGNAEHLLVQVDSAINPGNSGGPVVQGRSVVGVAFQAFTQAENTGYIIPTPVVFRFLKDIEDGRYDGHPQDGITTLSWAMLNPSAVSYHGLKPGGTGVKVAHVAPWAAAHERLIPGDVILTVDGQPIGEDGRVSFQGERVDFRALYDLKQLGDTAVFTVMRGGQHREVEVAVSAGRPHNRSEEVYALHPRFFVWGGLVFTRLSRSYLKTWGDQWYREAPLLLRYFDSYVDFEDFSAGAHDIMVYAKRLPDSVNAYATSNLFGVVETIDGQPVRTVMDLARLLEDGTGEFAIIRFFGSSEPIVMSRRLVRQRNQAILTKYGVEPDRWFAGPEADGAVIEEQRQEASPTP